MYGEKIGEFDHLKEKKNFHPCVHDRQRKDLNIDIATMTR